MSGLIEPVEEKRTALTPCVAGMILGSSPWTAVTL
jgi:hypothetical protein